MIKIIFKWVSILLLTILIFGGALASHEWYANKPFFFRSYLDRTMIKVAFDSPETLTSLGFLESIGIKGHNAELDDSSQKKSDELFHLMKHVKLGIENYSEEELNDSENLSREIALYLLNFGINSEQFRYHNYPVNQLFGIQNDYPSFMDAQHQVNVVEDAENYISRLSKVKLKFEQSLEGLKIREEKGIIPPLFVIERVLDEMTRFVEQPIEENILYSSLKTKIDDSDEISSKQQSAILAKVATQMQESVHPAYQILIEYFTNLKRKASTDDGF